MKLSLLVLVMEALLLSSVHAYARSCESFTNSEGCLAQEVCSWNCIVDSCECFSIPTSSPTISPIQESCHLPPNEYELDLLILVDTSCVIGTALCKRQQEEIAETITSVRGVQTATLENGDVINQVRVTYMEFSSHGISLIIGAKDDPINFNVTDPEQTRMDLYYKIRDDAGACNNMSQRMGSPQLYEAILEGMEELNQRANSLEIMRDQEILIYSNCGVDQEQRIKICQKFEAIAKRRGRYTGVNVFMVNNIYSNTIEDFIDPELYIMCAVEWDTNRVFVTNIEDDYYQVTMPDVRREVCEEMPSPAPTIDPTEHPTKNDLTTETSQPSNTPSSRPSNAPSPEPYPPSVTPTDSPTSETTNPSSNPTNDPTDNPSSLPTNDPTVEPTTNPSSNPTNNPTDNPTSQPSSLPTVEPTNIPASNPTQLSTSDPDTTREQESAPTNAPEDDSHNKKCPDESNPACNPTNDPTNEPTIEPTLISITVTGEEEEYSIPTTKPTTEPSPPWKSIPIWLWIILSALGCCCVGAFAFCILKQHKRMEDRAYQPATRADYTSSESDSGTDTSNEELEEQLRIMMIEDNLSDSI